jgi:hypothetical protein
MNERDQFTTIVAALLGSTSYSCLSRETISNIVDQARAVVKEINKEQA